MPTDLRAEIERFRSLLDSTPLMICRLRPDGTFLYANQAFRNHVGGNDDVLTGKNFFRVIPAEQRNQFTAALSRLCADEPRFTWTAEIPNGKHPKCLEWVAQALCQPGESLQEYQLIARDISEPKRQAIRRKEFDKALQLLIDHRQKEKEQFAEQVLENIKMHVFPYLEKFLNRNRESEDRQLLEIVHTNLKNITSASVNRLSSPQLGLTPTEIRIADLIKSGHSSKEIAGLMHVTPRAVAFHRSNIRKKLGLVHRKANLYNHLQSLK